MKGNDDEQTARSSKSDPIAKTIEKKGAPPPEKTAITIDEVLCDQEAHVDRRQRADISERWRRP
jgi:hypothetical protein